MREKVVGFLCAERAECLFCFLFFACDSQWYSLSSQIKRLKDLEKEKDALCSGLEVLEKTRLWYLQRLQENKAKKDVIKADCAFGSIYDATSEVRESGRSPESSR